MPTYLIDANLPYRFALWQGSDYVHVYDLSDSWTDLQIWNHARTHGLTIVSKDADFSALAMASEPPPRVVHLRIGNLKLQDLHRLLQALWPQVTSLSETHRLVTVFRDRIEGLR